MPNQEILILLTIVDLCVFVFVALILYLFLRRDFNKIKNTPYAIMKSIENNSTDLDTSMNDLSRAITSLIGRAVMISNTKTDEKIKLLEDELTQLKKQIEVGE